MANCSSAAENSELRVPQDSLFAAAVVVDENGLTFAARRGSQRGAGRSRRRPLGLLYAVRGDPAPWMDAMHVGNKRKIKNRWAEIQTSYDARAKGAAEAPPPACDWPAAVPRSAPRYRSLFATRIGKGVARLWPFGKYIKKWPNNQAMVTASCLCAGAILANSSSRLPFSTILWHLQVPGESAFLSISGGLLWLL